MTEQQVVLRAATEADADRLADFINTCTLAYQGVARSSPAEAPAQLYEHGTDPAVDTRLALVQDDIVGFGRVWAASDEELRLRTASTSCDAEAPPRSSSMSTARNVTSAVRLYTKAGMTPHPSFTIWGKEVQGAQR